eukprot:93512-Prymnesium_polylepis.1
MIDEPKVKWSVVRRGSTRTKALRAASLKSSWLASASSQRGSTSGAGGGLTASGGGLPASWSSIATASGRPPPSAASAFCGTEAIAVATAATSPRCGVHLGSASAYEMTAC